jgi:hypothetical protein
LIEDLKKYDIIIYFQRNCHQIFFKVLSTKTNHFDVGHIPLRNHILNPLSLGMGMSGGVHLQLGTAVALSYDRGGVEAAHKVLVLVENAFQTCDVSFVLLVLYLCHSSRTHVLSP